MSEASDETKVVLIVDRDAAESSALGRRLRQLGCEPQSCSDAHAALVAADRARLDLPAVPWRSVLHCKFLISHRPVAIPARDRASETAT